MKAIILIRLLWPLLLGGLLVPLTGKSYSILTHEAVIDASWAISIRPLLILKYPGSTEIQLKEAHAYAYGGAIAPDMGYFPFGSHFYTNLVHYVRSGDFVNALLDESQNLDEYAFALGFLCHYMSDRYGHFLGTNRCVPIVYPQMKKKYGNVVTYEEDKISHKRMEFAFDVLQTANGNYASKDYHDFIGFQVSRPLLERAFINIYGLDLNKIFMDLSLAIETFRWSVKSLFPQLTKVAWVMKKNEILLLQPTATSKSFHYKMSKTNYCQEFGGKYQKPGIFTHILSWVILVMPKVGPLRSLKLKEPGKLAEKIFIQSFDSVLLHYAAALRTLKTENISFNNIDFDTGTDTAPGEYPLADQSYRMLLLKLNDNRYEHINSNLKQDLITFFGTPDALPTTKKSSNKTAIIDSALVQLRSSNTF